MSEERKVVFVLAGIFFIIMMLYWYNPKSEHHFIKQYRLETKSIRAESPSDIIPIDTNLVEPILYSHVYFLDSLSADEAKQKFIDVMIPAILIVKWQLQKELERLEVIIEDGILDQGDSMLVANWFDQYKTDDLQTLKRRLLTHPNSIVLAQAAVESGWGKSRFFKEGNNVFGVWSYDTDEPRIPASISREEYRAYLRKYSHIAESVMDYFKTIARAPAYAGFRRKRSETSDIRELLPYLDKYSERGEEYVAQLMSMIRYNDFQKYDNYELDPAYVILD